MLVVAWLGEAVCVIEKNKGKSVVEGNRKNSSLFGYEKNAIELEMLPTTNSKRRASFYIRLRLMISFWSLFKSVS